MRIPLELEINSPGSHETSSVDFEVVFQGIRVNKKEVILQGSEAPVRIEAETLLILEGLVSRSNVKDKIHHDEEVIDAANEMICSVNREELAKSFALKVIQRMRKQRISKKDEPNHLLANIESLKKIQKKMLGTALKVFCDIIQDDAKPAKKKFYELKLSLLAEIGWIHLAKYKR
ncbi:hypothetical protein VNO77_02961 [Canavalia gladiata]|uniref:Uncharacterized protein n=1 Tax=Canavalia gladiata TaxID=3824 RepID=A0AAN9MUK0_CANGL